MVRSDRMLAAILLFAAACGSPNTNPAPAADRHSIARRDLLTAHTAIGRGEFVDGLAGAFASQGAFIAGWPVGLRGVSGARAWLNRDTLNAGSRAIIVPIGLDASSDGRDGYSYGFLDVVHVKGDTAPGYFSAYWRRNVSGKWEILAFGRSRRSTTRIPADLARTPSPMVAASLSDSATGIATLFGMERSFAEAAAKDVRAAFAEFAAIDGAKGNGESFVFGKDAISRLFGEEPNRPGPKWSPEWGTIATSGDLGFTTGGVLPQTPGGPGGRYFTIWKRQANGTWRYVFD